MYDKDPTADLAGEYYDSVYESVDKLLAIGGFRIAALLGLQSLVNRKSKER